MNESKPQPIIITTRRDWMQIASPEFGNPSRVLIPAMKSGSMQEIEKARVLMDSLEGVKAADLPPGKGLITPDGKGGWIELVEQLS